MARGSILGVDAWKLRPSRYDAGRFGRGYKPRPKSTASIPLAGLVVAELHGHRPADRSALFFPDASRYRLRHAYLRTLRPARVIDEPRGYPPVLLGG